jgi:hypothetical protein
VGSNKSSGAMSLATRQSAATPPHLAASRTGAAEPQMRRGKGTAAPPGLRSQVRRLTLLLCTNTAQVLQSFVIGYRNAHVYPVASEAITWAMAIAVGWLFRSRKAPGSPTAGVARGVVPPCSS